MKDRKPITADYFNAYNITDDEMGKSRWILVGRAYNNRDGSISVLLDTLPESGSLQLRKPRLAATNSANGNDRRFTVPHPTGCASATQSTARERRNEDAIKEIKIETPYGTKNWSFVQKCFDGHQPMIDALEALLLRVDRYADRDEGNPVFLSSEREQARAAIRKARGI